MIHLFPKRPRQRCARTSRFTIGILLLSAGCTAKHPTVTPSTDWENNFGYPRGFAVSKMDSDAKPRSDFRRYAAGLWFDAASIPGESFGISSFEVLNKTVERQVQSILEEAQEKATVAGKGSALQQVGDFYASGQNVELLTKLGVSPIHKELDRISRIQNRKQLSQSLARLSLLTNQPVLFGAAISTDTQDRNSYAIYAVDGELVMGAENYLAPEMQSVRDAYRKFIVDALVIAGVSAPEAKADSVKILEIETRLARKKLSPVERQDPSKLFVRMSRKELKKVVSNIDLEAYMAGLGIPVRNSYIVADVGAIRERNKMLSEYPLSVTRAYLRWELLRQMVPYLTPALLEPSMDFARARFGKIETPPRARLVAAEIPKLLGHPLSHLYVTKHFTPETKRTVEELIGRIRSEFRSRLEKNSWLSEETRHFALNKLDRVKISVGYPEKWIDLSSVDIRRDDYAGNVLRINTFLVRRDVARLGKPVTSDEFADPRSTLPIVVNAAYQPDQNSIEIPAAFLQPPFYDHGADAGVNFCAIGAVIGHEITHGFDSQGRLYDAEGNVRSWWTEADAKNFLAEASKLVDQASSFEVLPGLPINGQLAVGENLADVGGISFGYGALQRFLQEHPEQNRKIDNLTPQQRCFLSWAQTWADKWREGFLRQMTPVDPHPPGVYRMSAPSQHEKGFYEAFGIKAGDPMWLEEKKRVSIW